MNAIDSYWRAANYLIVERDLDVVNVTGPGEDLVEVRNWTWPF